MFVLLCFPPFPHWPKGLVLIIELVSTCQICAVINYTPPQGKRLHDKAPCLASSIKLSWRQEASTLISLFWVPLTLSDPLCEVHVGENWKRVACTKSSLVANSGRQPIQKPWQNLNILKWLRRRCHSECLGEHPKYWYYTQTWHNYLLRKRECYPACGRRYLRGPWKLCELSVWSQGGTVCSSSSRVGQQTGRGREKGRGWVGKTNGFFKVWTGIKSSAYYWEVMFSPWSSNCIIPQIMNYLHDTTNVFTCARGDSFYYL